MKAKDLKSNYTFATRRPYLADHVLYVPDYYSNYAEYVLPPFQEVFGKDLPVCIEYCSGNGDWIVEKAVEEPEKNWIAVEMRFDRVRKIWAKLKNRNIQNLLLVCGEAWTFTHHYVPAACIEEVYIHFPDPWPKLRHAKNRLMQRRFLDELSRVLLPGGGMTFVSDELGYVEETVSLFEADTRFRAELEAPHFVTQQSAYGSSWFEELWRQKGKEIHYTKYVHADET